MSGSRAAFADWLGTTNDVTRTFLSAGQIPDLINLAGGLPAPESYPVEKLAEIAQRVVREFPQQALGYGAIEGLPDLRDALAARFSTPSLRLSRENVLITSSGMQGLDLLGKILLQPGELIAAQSPTYLGALDAWRPLAPSYRSWSPEQPDFDPAKAFDGAKFAYTVPNFSNPTGRLVDLPMRRRLVEAAMAAGTWLVEDDPYGTLHYDGAPLPRLIDLAAETHSGSYDGPVIYMGTLSKEIAPGLRIGWVVAAPAVIGAMTLAKQGSDMCTSGVTQLIALEAIRAGLIERINPLLLETYRSRRDALCVAMEQAIAPWFTWEKPVGGMFVWATARRADIDTDILLKHALAAGVCITPSSVFDSAGTNRSSIRINFTLNEPVRLAEGISRLATALMTMQAPRS